MPETTVGDVRIHYQDIGTGDPVVLLHGGMASGEFWKGAGYVDALAGSCRVLLPDFRGHGRSSRLHDEKQYGVPYDVADVVAVLDHAGVESATFCGWSWGGTVSLAVAAVHPDRVNAVLTTGTAGRHVFKDIDMNFSRFPEMARKLDTDGMPGMAKELERLGGQRWLHDLMLDNDAVALAAWYRGQIDSVRTDRAAADITAPVLLLAGEEEVDTLNFPDPVLPRHARTHVIAGENHVTAFLRSDILVPALLALLAGRHPSQG